MEIEKTMKTDDVIRYQKAKVKAREIRDFYINLSLFCLFIPLIVGINLYFVPKFQWFWFSIIGWGVGVFFHAANTFEIFSFFKSTWEKRKIAQFIKEEIEQEQNKNNAN